MNRQRYLFETISGTLAKKMVFIGGPRQVGKTTFGLSLLGEKANEQHPAYMNWDNHEHAALLRQGRLPVGPTRVLLDEIHKYKNWRRLIKGFWDTHKTTHQLIVTGSARLDYYRKGGDSLANRYRYFRLHPLSVCELSLNPNVKVVDDLLKWGGFPEPFFAKNEAEHRIWQRDRLSRVIKQDLRDLENVREISLIEFLVDLLPQKIGSPLSIKSIREDLEVDHKTVERWLQILENLYVCFRIAPFGAPKIRAVKKEKKLYLYDWSCIDSDGARFENLVAAQLLKYCHFVEDTEGYKMELRYLRDTDLREVDFVVLQDNRPKFAVECKTGDKAVSKNIRYFSERTNIPVFYQVHLRNTYFDSTNIKVRPFWIFCKELGLP